MSLDVVRTAILLAWLGQNIIRNEASRRNKKCRISEDINSGNSECKIMPIILYAATTFPKADISGINSTVVLRRKKCRYWERQRVFDVHYVEFTIRNGKYFPGCGLSLKSVYAVILCQEDADAIHSL